MTGPQLRYLLENQGQFAEKCDLSLIPAEDWWLILRKQPQLAEYCPEWSFRLNEWAELLRERLKLEPSKVLAIDKKYGKMDWRVPESQAIYWATEGIERTPGKEDLRCARLITQSLQAAFRGGRLLSLDDKNLA